MPTEAAQLLSTAHRVLDGVPGVKLSSNNRKLKTWTFTDYREDTFYKVSHYNHPCAVWARKSINNYNWLYSLFVELNIEYTARYKRTHLTEIKLKDALVFPPDNCPKAEFTDPPQAMDLYPQCKVPGDTVQAYRNYYKEIKSEIAEWRYSPKPYWYN